MNEKISFLTAAWRNLLMANYVIDRKALLPYLPAGTELDSFKGDHMISLVGFLFDETKVKGIGFPFHKSFEEVNLRFYVRYKDHGKWNRGVVFIKEIVPKRMIGLIANTLYGEHYITRPMKHSWQISQETIQVAYEWKINDKWNYMKATADAKAEAIREGSEEEFITEHYWGYTFINKGCTGVYEVIHPRWKTHSIQQFDMYCTVKDLYGAAFEEALSQPPRTVFLADGSEVTVNKGNKILIHSKAGSLQ